MTLRRAVPFLLLLGLLVRVLYLDQVAGLPFFHDPVGDAARHLERAREILDGELIGDRPFFYGGAFYPYIIALFLAAAPGDGIYAILFVQILLGCATGWLLYRFCLLAVPSDSGRAVGVVAAGLAMFYGPFAFLEADLLMISWTLFFLASAGCLLLAARRPVAGSRALAMLTAAGAGIGLAASERPNLAAMLPLVALWILVSMPGRRGAMGAMGTLAGGAAILAAVTGLNVAASGRVVLLTTSSGINFYIGNNERATGTFDEPWSASDSHFTAINTDLESSSILMASRLSGRALGPVETSRYWFRRGLDHLRANPTGTARLWARKLALFWNGAEIPNHLNFSFMRSVAPALWLMPLGFALVAPLAAYGLFSGSARRLIDPAALGLLGIMILVPMLTVLPFFIADRYRIPAVAPLMVLASCGVVDLIRRVRGREGLGGHVRAGLAAMAGTLVLVLWPLTGFDTSRDHWMLAQAYKKAGDRQGAIRHYETAVAIAPEDALLRNNLGVAVMASGNEAEAEAQYRKAIELDRGLAFPRKNLGLLLLRRGEREEAFEWLVSAESIDPGDIDVARALALLYLERGEVGAAVRHAEQVLESSKTDPAALEVLEAAGKTP